MSRPYKVKVTIEGQRFEYIFRNDIDINILGGETSVFVSKTILVIIIFYAVLDHVDWLKPTNHIRTARV